MSETTPEFQSWLETARDALHADRPADALTALATAEPLLAASVAHRKTMTAVATLQAASMSLRAGDPELARKFAELVLTDIVPDLEWIGSKIGDAWKADIAWTTDNAPNTFALLRRSYLYTLAFVPFVRPLPRVQAFTMEGQPPAEPFVRLIEGVRTQLDAAEWATWKYPEDLAGAARHWSAVALAQTGRFLMLQSGEGTLVEQAQQFADAALALIESERPDQLLADALNLKARILDSYGPRYLEDAIALFERAIGVEVALANEEDACVDEMNVGAMCVKLGDRLRAEGKLDAAHEADVAAEGHLRAAIARFGKDEQLAAALTNLAVFEMGRQRWPAAHDHLSQAWKLVEHGPRESRANVALNIGAVLIEWKDWKAGALWFRIAVDDLDALGHIADRTSTFKANGGLGVTLLFSAGPDAAEPYLARAIEEIERLRSSFFAAYANLQLLKTHLWIYEGWIECNARLGESDPERRATAFAAAERIKWTMFTETLRFEPLRLPGYASEPLIREEQDLLAELRPAMLAPPAQTARTLKVDAALRRLDAIWDELEPHHPQHVAIRRDQTVSARDACAVLNDEVPLLLEYYLGDSYETALAFVLRRGDSTPSVVTLPNSPAELGALVEVLHRCNSNTPAVVYDDVLRRLHAALLAPVLAMLPEKAGICVVPYGPLHNVPFGALHDGARYAVERNAFVIAQSATALRWWVEKDRNERGRCLIFTATDKSSTAAGQFGDLRLFADLARNEIAPLFPQTKLIAGAEATKAALLSELEPSTASWDVAHIACHGVFEAGGLASFLVLAPDGSADNSLRAYEIAARVRPDTTLVTLSACESGIADTVGDDVAGLAQAFLLAGASSVLASMWPVHQGAAVALTRRFYELWIRGGDGGTPLTKVRALQRVQHDLIGKHIVSASPKLDLSHPYQWAAFQLYGDWD